MNAHASRSFASRSQQAKSIPSISIVGDDEAEMSHLAAELSGLVEDELRAFNVERFYATDKSASAGGDRRSGEQLPMMATRRVVVVLRAEQLLKPKRKGKASEECAARARKRRHGPTRLLCDALEAYVKQPAPQTVLVLVAADVDRTQTPLQGAAEARHDRRVLGPERQQGRAGRSAPGRAAGRAARSAGRGRRRAADRATRPHGSSPNAPAPTSRACAATSIACCFMRRGSRGSRWPMRAKS